MSTVKVTAADIRAAMLKRYPPGEYALLWEVADGTGSRINRYADAMIMSLWPSRGLELAGVEIKVSRSDWKREALDPNKAEALAKFCDRWWIITGPGVIADVGELPPLWGWQEFDGKRWVTHKLPEKRTDVAPVSRLFLAAMLRRSDQVSRRAVEEHARAAIDAANEAIEKQISGEVERRSREFEELTKVIAEFEEAVGIKIADGWSGGKVIGEKFAAFQKLDVASKYSSFVMTAGSLERAAKDMREFIETMNGRES